MQWIVILVVFGGLGYNIIFNFYQYLKIYVLEFFDRKRIHKQVSIMTLNSKIVLYTTGALLVGGICVFMDFRIQQYHELHQTWFGKITTAAFNAVTPRTAGFNTMDFTNIPFQPYYLSFF
jgi:trk system potassium uptake protein